MIQIDGFQEYEERRRNKFDKQIGSNVMISSKGLDEGVDRWDCFLAGWVHLQSQRGIDKAFYLSLVAYVWN